MNRAEEYRQFCVTHPLRSRLVDGVCWEYIDTLGPGEALLLLPGGFGVADTSFRLIRAFTPRYRVVSLTYPTSIRTFGGLVDGVAGLVRELGLKAAHVLGGSASGLVAQELVRRHPALVRSLILSHTGVPQQARARWISPALALLGLVPLPVARHFFHACVRAFLPGDDAEQQFWRGYFHARVDELSRESLLNRFHVLIDIDRNARFAPGDLDRWRRPLLMIAAEDDGFVGKREQAALRRLYPRADVHTFPRGAHRDSITTPEAEIAVIDGFLRRYGSSSTCTM